MNYSFEAIGTQWSIDVQQEVSSRMWETLKRLIADRIELFDKTYSRFRPDSLVTQMSRTSGSYTLPEDAKSFLAFYHQLYKITEGAVTPLIGNVLSDAGYDADYSLKSQKLRKPESWESVLSYTYPELTVKKPVILDFGAAGKGYLVDIIGNILEDNHITEYLIDGSGDILYKSTGNDAIRIGLEHPENPKQAIGVATLTNGSLCGSAGNRRKWGDFHHILDPRSLKSPKHTLAVWVTAKTAMLADGLTTCLFFTRAEILAKYFDFEYCLIREDYSLEKSKGFPGEFFYK